MGLLIITVPISINTSTFRTIIPIITFTTTFIRRSTDKTGVGNIQLEMSILGSGSKGNSVFFKTPKSSFLVDAGLSAKQIKLRMNEIGQDPCSLDFILVTHEHSDHIRGIPRLVKLYGVKVFANDRTFDKMRNIFPSDLKHLSFTTGKTFKFKDLRITPLPVSHDAAEPVSFIIRTGNIKTALLTDSGFVSNELLEHLNDLDVFIVEANHDVEMLMEGPYPLFLKRRICSLTGHLSNVDAAQTIIKTSLKKRTHVFLAHMSETNNHPDIAYSCVRELMEEHNTLGQNLHLTYQDRPTNLFQIPLTR